MNPQSSQAEKERMSKEKQNMEDGDLVGNYL
jgi:hypothetical protein